MPFCMNCGAKIADKDKFCTNCGAANKRFSSERKTVYEGQLHKCPNCGELLDAFRSHCPSCGLEIRGAQSSSSVRELTRKLEQIESERMAPIEEKKSLMKMVLGKDFNDKDEIEKAQNHFDAQKLQQKINLIINYSVPNTREDIVEFMILACSNIDVKKGIGDDVTKAWISKLDQVYEKAKLLMSENPDFAQIEQLYYSKKSQITNRKYKSLSTACFCFGGWILLMSLLFFLDSSIGTAIVLLLVGAAIVAGGVKFITIYDKNNKLNL